MAQDAWAKEDFAECFADFRVELCLCRLPRPSTFSCCDVVVVVVVVVVAAAAVVVVVVVGSRNSSCRICRVFESTETPE